MASTVARDRSVHQAHAAAAQARARRQRHGEAEAERDRGVGGATALDQDLARCVHGVGLVRRNDAVRTGFPAS